MASANDEQRSSATPSEPGAGLRRQPPAGEGLRYSVETELPLPGRPLRPLVDLVARIGVNIHLKLLAGFLLVVLLLLGMGILSLVVIGRMNDRVGELTDLQETVDLSRQMLYLVTAQSHFRGMALVCELERLPPTASADDCTAEPPWNERIANAKQAFGEGLDSLAAMNLPERDEVLGRLRQADDRYAVASARALDSFQAGDVDAAVSVHMIEEHEISHELERTLNGLVSDSSAQMAQARASFRSDRNLLTGVVVMVSGVTLATALVLGFVLSWAFIRPVRRIDHTLKAIALGDFSQRVEVPNRDEFGTLSANLNHASQRLQRLYDELQSLNENLQKRVDEQLEELEREVQGRERIEQELRVAHDIQLAFLPKELPQPPGWQVKAYYRPARAVGGDFYDFISLPGGRLGIVVGDVSSKGVPAALVMCATRSMLRAAAQRLDPPGAVLAQVNELLYRDIPPNMYVTCLYTVLDLDSGAMRFANAGHNLPYLTSGGGVTKLRATGMPLGLMPAMTYEEQTATVGPGHGVLFHSDGLAEAHNDRREMFGLPRLMALVERHQDGPQLIDLLVAELARFTGDGWEQEDDVTLVDVRRSAAVPAPTSALGEEA